MNCKKCGKEIVKHRQCPGQWNKLCFECWHDADGYISDKKTGSRLDGIPDHVWRAFVGYNYNVGDNWKRNL